MDAWRECKSEPLIQVTWEAPCKITRCGEWLQFPTWSLVYKVKDRERTIYIYIVSSKLKDSATGNPVSMTGCATVGSGCEEWFCRVVLCLGLFVDTHCLEPHTYLHAYDCVYLWRNRQLARQHDGENMCEQMNLRDHFVESRLSACIMKTHAGSWSLRLADRGLCWELF